MLRVILAGIFNQALYQHIGIENINTHISQDAVRLAGYGFRSCGLLLKAFDTPGFINPKHTKMAGF
jgi:hypothetical protein